MADPSHHQENYPMTDECSIKTLKRKSEEIDPLNLDLHESKKFKFVRLTKTEVDSEQFSKNMKDFNLKPRYEAFKKSYQSGLEIKMFEEPIPRNIISPNQLQGRFIGKTHITIFKSEVCKGIVSIISEFIERNNQQITITGPIGIGKSVGLLAAVLKLRNDGNIVLYINNPEAWIKDSEAARYIIKELIYASIPVAKNFPSPFEGEEDLEEWNLFKWYCLLTYHSISNTFEQTMRAFISALSHAAETAEKRIFMVCDQANVLTRLNNENKIYGECFPYYIRKTIGEFQIYSVSANNTNAWTDTDINAISIFKRMSVSEINTIAKLILERELIEDESKVLYKMCNGNPLEAKDTLQAYVMQKTFNDIDLIPFLSDNFQKRVDEITTRHEKNFLSDKDLVFKAEFDAILPFVDTNINIKNSYIEETIRKVMNRQFMTINPKTYYLECLHPAASHAFKKLRKGLPHC